MVSVAIKIDPVIIMSMNGQHKTKEISVHSFVNLFIQKLLYTLYRFAVEMKPISGTLGVRQKETLEGIPIHHRTPCTHNHRIIHTYV